MLDLLQGEGRWTQREFARDGGGTPLDLDLEQERWKYMQGEGKEGEPACFCLVEAVMEMTRKEKDRGNLWYFCYQVLVTTSLESSQEIGGVEWFDALDELMSVTSWNDYEGRTRAEVLDRIQETVNCLKEREKRG